MKGLNITPSNASAHVWRHDWAAMHDLAAIHHADMLGEFATEIKVLFVNADDGRS